MAEPPKPSLQSQLSEDPSPEAIAAYAWPRSAGTEPSSAAQAPTAAPVVATEKTYFQSLLDNIVLVVTTELVALPFCFGGEEGAMNGDWRKALIGFGIGLPIGIVGITFPVWGRRLADATQQWLRKDAWKWWMPLAAVTLFVYVLGPDVYRRAMSQQPTAQNIATAVAQALRNELPRPALAPAQKPPEDVFGLIASLRSQLDDADAKLQSTQRQLADTQDALDKARKPPLDPRAIPTWLRLDFDATGAATETKSTNVHWSVWFGSEAVACSGLNNGLGGTSFNFGVNCASPETVVFLSFDKPISYEDISIQTNAAIPQWEVRQKTEKTALIVFHGNITTASLSIEVIK